MAYKRINLFREIVPAHSPGNKVYAWHVPLLGTALILCLLFVGMAEFRFLSEKARLNRERQQAELHWRQLAPAEPLPTLADRSSTGHAKSWTVFLWKLSAITAPDIVFQKVALGELPDTKKGSKDPNDELNPIIVEGEASSAYLVGKWVSDPMFPSPVIDFSVEPKDNSTEQFPVKFRIRVKAP